MSANAAYDVLLVNGAGQFGYILARDPKTRGRAWQRTGVSDSLSTQRRLVKSLYAGGTEEYGGLPAELDAPIVFDDWSGGHGHYTQRSEHFNDRDNHYHLAFNFDTRFAGVLFHAQAPQLLAARYASAAQDVDFIIDLPPLGTGDVAIGSGQVMLVSKGVATALAPTGLLTAGSAFDQLANNLSNTLGHRPAVFGSLCCLPSLDGSGFWTVLLGTTNFAAVQTSMPATWFQVAGDRLWRGHSRNLVQSCAVGADPTVTSNWSATLSLSNGNNRMGSADAFAFENKIFVGFPDGLYMGDLTGTFNNVVTDVGFNVDPWNVRDITAHNGQVVFAEGTHVWGYKPSTGANSVLRQLWPNNDTRLTGSLSAPSGQQGMPFRGRVTCVHGFGRWLYAGMFTGSQSILWCGVDASAPLPYVWHPMQLLPHTCKISRIHVDSITAASRGTDPPVPRRMWIATDATFGTRPNCTAPVYYWPIPQGDESPFADPTFTPNYTAQAYLEHPITDWGAPGTWKALRKIEMWAEIQGSATGSANLQVSLVVDGTMVASMPNSTLTGFPKSTGYFNNSLSSAIGQGVQLAVTSTVATSPAALTTPVYHSFVIRANEHPRSVDTITMKLRIADNMHDRQQNQMRDAKTQLAELRTLAKSSNPIMVVDLTGATAPVTMFPTVEEEESYQQGSDDPEVVATVKLGVLDASWSAFAVVNADGG